MPLRWTPSAAAFTLVVAGLSFALAPPAGAKGDKDCGDFNTQAAAQDFFLEEGGPQQDPNGLDADGDGIACESNPCPCSDDTGDGGGEEPKAKRDWARVIRVIDGDTIRVKIVGGLRRNVRLIGIDTPEVYGGTECGGEQASKSARKMLPRRSRVRLESDPSQQLTDRYGRLLRYVARKGRDVNRRQVARGWARVYVYDNKPFRRVKPYRRSHAQAKDAERGVWGAC